MAARMNISIPDELKVRMDDLGESVNWSRIAAQAFERRLDADRDSSVRDLAPDVRAAASKPSTEALAAILDLVRDSRPEFVEAVKQDLGPVFERSLDREHLRERMNDWKCEVPWPLESAEDFVKVIRQVVLGYHERVVDPLFAQVLGEVVFHRLSSIAEKHRP